MATDKYSNSTSETGRNYKITEAYPWLGSNYTEYNTNEGGGYHFRRYPNGRITKMNGSTGEFEPINQEYDPELYDYLVNRANILDQNSDHQRLNIVGTLMPNFLLNTKVGNYLGTMKNGGYMNYLQQGGEMNNQLEQIIVAFKENPMAVIKEVGPEHLEEFLGTMAQVADETQDSDLKNIVDDIVSEISKTSTKESNSEETEEFKCGGKVRAKIKKACGGVKMVQKGDALEAQANAIADKLASKYPQYDRDQRAGRKPIIKNGKKYFMNGDGKLIEADKLQQEKRGGKVKKAEAGEPITRTWTKNSSSFSIKEGKRGMKTTCPCQLHRIGGKIVEVNSCTGLPMAKNGGKVKKFKEPFESLGPVFPYENSQVARPEEEWISDIIAQDQISSIPFLRPQTWARSDGQYDIIPANGYGYTTAQEQTYKPGENVITLSHDPQQALKNRLTPVYRKNGTVGGYYDKTTGLQYAPSGKIYRRDSNGTWQPTGRTYDNGILGLNFDLVKEEVAAGEEAVRATRQAQAENENRNQGNSASTNTTPATVTPKETRQYGIFQDSGLTDRSFGGRKKWIADNAEYLKSLGWDDARIAGYKGSAKDNLDLLKAIQGKADWDAKQTETVNTPDGEATPGATPGVEVTPETEAIPAGRYTNQQLLDMTSSEGLTPEETVRRTALQVANQFNQQTANKIISNNSMFNQNTDFTPYLNEDGTINVDKYNQDVDLANATSWDTNTLGAGKDFLNNHKDFGKLKRFRFGSTAQDLNNDEGLRSAAENGESIDDYIKQNYHGADRIRARRILNNPDKNISVYGKNYMQQYQGNPYDYIQFIDPDAYEFDFMNH